MLKWIVIQIKLKDNKLHILDNPILKSAPHADPKLIERAHFKCFDHKLQKTCIFNMDNWEVLSHVTLFSHCEFMKGVVYVGFHLDTVGKKNLA